MALGDVYSQQVFAPSQQLLQQQTAAAQSLPGLHQQGIAIRDQEIEQQRLNRPITPWQRAAMELASGGDPKVIAARLKAETGGAMGGVPVGPGVPPGMPPPSPNPAPGASLGAGQAQGSHIPSSVSQAIFGPPQSGGPQVSMPPAGPGYGVQGPQPLTNPDTMGMGGTPAQEQYRYGANGMDMTGMQRPMQGQLPMRSQMPQQSRGGMGGEDIYSGMNGRDFRDYMATVGPIHKANMSARESRDRLAEIRLMNEGRVENTREGNKGKKEVAEVRATVDREKMKSRELTDELNRRIKQGLLDEKVADNIADNQLGWAKLQEVKRQFLMSRSGDERLKAAKMLLEHSASLSSSIAKVDSTLWGRAGAANADIKKELSEWQVEADEAKEAAQKFIDEYQPSAEPNIVTGSEERKAKGATGPIAPRANPTGPRQNPPPAGATKTFKNKKTGATETTTQAMFDDAVRKKLIDPTEWE
jgi:hypothetical protein